MLPLMGVLLILLFTGDTAAEEYTLAGTFQVRVSEPSGLAYDPEHKTLWTVRDGGGGVYEIDKKGKTLKKLPVVSSDLEGIAYKPDSQTFLLAEERKRQVVEIDRKGKVIKTIDVPIRWHYWNINSGIEGVAYDPKSRHIFVANEKNPRMVMELEEDGKPVNFFEVKDALDLSDIYCDYTRDTLLVLSHESKKVMEFTRQGRLLSTFPVEATKAEGITKDEDGNLYIMCEETKRLYVYAPKTPKPPVTTQRRTR